MDTFGIKELYDIDLKATSNVEIGGRIFLPGEAILSFDELQLSILNEQKNKYQRTWWFSKYNSNTLGKYRFSNFCL